MRYQLPRPDIKAYEVGFLHAGGDIPYRPHPAATQLVVHYLDFSNWTEACERAVKNVT